VSESREHDSQSRIPNTQAAADSVIQFRDVDLKITGKALVEKLRFDIQRSETLVLLGRSGSGKTTTLKLINRLLEPTSGEIRVEGKPTLDWDPRYGVANGDTFVEAVYKTLPKPAAPARRGPTE